MFERLQFFYPTTTRRDLGRTVTTWTRAYAIQARPMPLLTGAVADEDDVRATIEQSRWQIRRPIGPLQPAPNWRILAEDGLQYVIQAVAPPARIDGGRGTRRHYLDIRAKGLDGPCGARHTRDTSGAPEHDRHPRRDRAQEQAALGPDRRRVDRHQAPTWPRTSPSRAWAPERRSRKPSTTCSPTRAPRIRRSSADPSAPDVQRVRGRGVRAQPDYERLARGR